MNTFQDYSYGIIPVRKIEDRIECLVVKHTHGKHWGFPKGHPERDESPYDTAVRELFEETGLDAFDSLSQEFYEKYSFFWQGRLCYKTVTYFISKVKGTLSTNLEEISEARWVSFEETLNLFNFESARSIVVQAEKFLKQKGNYF